MKAINWEEIEEGGSGFADLPTGGYVMRVTDVIDEEDYRNNFGDVYDRIVIRYDVAEGPNKDFFASNNKPDFTHEHEFRYNPANCGEKFEWSVKQFKKFWNTVLPESNGGWTWDMDVKSFVGKLFGATVRHRYYTKADGDDGSSTQLQGFYTAQAIRDGNFKEPKDVDTRKPQKKAPEASQEPYELPF